MASNTILVVDDEDQVQRLMAQTLEAAGFSVLVASNGVEALDRLGQRSVDLIVADVAMPVMDGPTLYQRVRARPEWLSIPFIFLTAFGEPVRIRSAYAAGVDDYLVKPCSGEDLVARVRGLLLRRKQLDQSRSELISRIKESLLVVMNHELRTPLTTIWGYAQLLETAPAGQQQELVRSATAGILRGTARLRRLAEDLVLLVELRSGDAAGAFGHRRRLVRDLPLLLAEALRSQRDEAADRDVRLVSQLPSTLPPLLGDPDLLVQATARLLNNGIKFSKAGGGSVRLSAWQEGESLRIEVADDGIGIGAEELARVSEAFYQVDRPRLEQQGTGSGLAIAQAAIALHGGELTIHSEPGVGTRVCVRLPVAAEQGVTARDSS